MVLGLNGNIAESLSHNNMLGTTTLQTPMKKKLIDKLLLPCVQRKWEELHHNYLLWNSRLRSSFQSPEDNVYLLFLQSLELMVNKYKKEGHFVYVLPPIKLKPEYEIYKMLYGNKIDKEKVNRIANFMKRDGMTIQKIKELL